MAALSFLFKEVLRQWKIGKSEISLANVLYFFVGIFFYCNSFFIKKKIKLWGKLLVRSFSSQRVWFSPLTYQTTDLPKKRMWLKFPWPLLTRCFCCYKDPFGRLLTVLSGSGDVLQSWSYEPIFGSATFPGWVFAMLLPSKHGWTSERILGSLPEC